MNELKLLMRTGFAISFIGHLAVVTLGLVFAGANPFDAVPAEAIAVDIISPEEIIISPEDIRQTTNTPAPPVEATNAFETPKPAAPAAEAAAASLPLPPQSMPLPPQLMPLPPQSMPHPNVERTARQAQPQSQPIEPTGPPQETNMADMFGLPLALPDGRLGGGFDAPAIDRPKISADNIATFREHLKTCLVRPGSVAATDKIRVVLRVILKPDATLAATPTLIEASASAKGLVLMESAISGLRACQPYAMLPANKYSEWKVLDLSFTPQDFAGG